MFRRRSQATLQLVRLHTLNEHLFGFSIYKIKYPARFLQCFFSNFKLAIPTGGLRRIFKLWFPSSRTHAIGSIVSQYSLEEWFDVRWWKRDDLCRHSVISFFGRWSIIGRRIHYRSEKNVMFKNRATEGAFRILACRPTSVHCNNEKFSLRLLENSVPEMQF